MKKISIALCTFALSTLLFSLTVSADEPNVIKLSDLEDGQELVISDKDTVLDIDTDKTLSAIEVINCDLTITGTGSLKVIDTSDCSTWYSDSIRNESGSINITGGHIECDCIEGKELTISDDLFVLKPWNEEPVDGRLYGGCYYYEGEHIPSIRIAPKDEVVYVEGISFEESSYTVDKMQQIFPKVSFYPENASNQNLIWESSDSSIVYVSYGDVVGVNYGTATITATSEDGSFSASCEVTVPEPEPREDKGLCLKFEGYSWPDIHSITIDGETLEEGKDYFLRYNDETETCDLILENFTRKN